MTEITKEQIIDSIIMREWDGEINVKEAIEEAWQKAQDEARKEILKKLFWNDENKVWCMTTHDKSQINPSEKTA